MPQNTFAFWQAARGLVWSVGVLLAGYALGSHIKNVDHYLLPIIAVIIFVSLIPIGVEPRVRVAPAEGLGDKHHGWLHP
jgi:membrane-associated protein